MTSPATYFALVSEPDPAGGRSLHPVRHILIWANPVFTDKCLLCGRPNSPRMHTDAVVPPDQLEGFLKNSGLSGRLCSGFDAAMILVVMAS